MTTFRTRASTQCSSRLNVASAMTSMAKRGSAAQWVIRKAAWWKTRSRPASSRAIVGPSRMSPSTRLTGALAMAAARFSARPRTMLSMTTISLHPASTRPSTIREPTKPAPPVTRTRASRGGTAAVGFFEGATIGVM